MLMLTGLAKGILQNALREAIAASDNATEAQRWHQYLASSIDNIKSNLTNSTRNSELPLDRFSVGSNMFL